MGSAFLRVRTGYLTEEYILCGAQAFDRQQKRQPANRHAAKELLGVILATASQLPASMRILLKAVNLFREPDHQVSHEASDSLNGMHGARLDPKFFWLAALRN